MDTITIGYIEPIIGSNKPVTEDLVLYVRKIYGVGKVLIRFEENSNVKEVSDVILRNNLIFRDESEVDENLLYNNPIVVFSSSNIDEESDDFGIKSFVSTNKNLLGVTSITVMMDIDDINMSRIYYSMDSTDSTVRFLFRSSFLNSIRVRDSDIDITDFDNRLTYMDKIHELNYKSLFDTIIDIESGITKDTRIVFGDSNITYTKRILCTYITAKHGLVPAYPYSYAEDFCNMGFGYNIGKLSLYERIMFVRSLPNPFGYVPKTKELSVVFLMSEIIYPSIVFGIDMYTKTVIDGELLGSIEDYRLIDTRTLFNQKDFNYTPEASGLVLTDNAIDRKMTITFHNACPDNIYKGNFVLPNWKNSVLAVRKSDNRQFILYMPEEFGIKGVVHSNLMGATNYLLTESEFNRIVSVNLAISIAASSGFYDMYSKLSVNEAGFYIKPACSFDVTLASLMLKYPDSGMCLYDASLRYFRDAMSYIQDTTSTLYRKSSLEQLNISSLFKDEYFLNSITSFGTVKNNKLNLSYKAFGGIKLP